jgi:hypothetical protein
VPLKQMDDQRPRGITAIKHQEIVGVKFMELLKQHLPLAKIGAVEFCGQDHLQAWQIKEARGNTQIIPARCVK